MNDELIAYYVNLLILQYQAKPKARAHIAALIQELMIYEVAVSVRDGFNIETATGKQLDILAKYAGVNRVITGVSFDRTYWGMALYSDSAPFTFAPFAKYTDINVDVQFRQYVEDFRAIFALNDPELRLIIKLGIIRNTGIASIPQIDMLLAQYFGTDIIFSERYPMAEGFIFQEYQRRLVSIIKSEDLFPKPAGVAISVSFTKDIGHIFGYRRYGIDPPSFITGYREYGGPTTGGWAFYGET